MTIRILQGDCIEQMRTLPDNSVDSVVTDPPYGIGFMGKAWDGKEIADRLESRRGALSADGSAGPNGAHKSAAAHAGQYDLSPAAMRAFQAFSAEWAREAFRVLKPGGHLISFASTRTYHRMVCGIEEAGFEIRDCIRSLNGDDDRDHYPAWLFGSGFPKSLDVSKAIDKAAGAEREVRGVIRRAAAGSADATQSQGRNYRMGSEQAITEPATDSARDWEGWGTALKPAWEPICLARKPLAGTVAANVLEYGTGGLNIDGCRIATDDKLGGGAETGTTADQKGNQGWTRPWMEDEAAREAHAARVRINVQRAEALGRWPANVIHDGSPEVVAQFPRKAGAQSPVKGAERSAASSGDITGERARVAGPFRADAGSAARFFWCPKASPTDRHAGLQHPGAQFTMGRLPHHGEKVNAAGRGNHHPTVKPTELMRYLCRLVTPPGGLVLDPFMGSGSTLKAAELEGFSAIGIDKDPEYCRIARARIAADAPLFAEVE